MARSRRSGKGGGKRATLVVGRKAGLRAGGNMPSRAATKRGGPSNISKVVGSKGGATVGRNVDQYPAQYSYTGTLTPAAIGKVSTSGNQTLKDYRRKGQ